MTFAVVCRSYAHSIYSLAIFADNQFLNIDVALLKRIIIFNIIFLALLYLILAMFIRFIAKHLKYERLKKLVIYRVLLATLAIVFLVITYTSYTTSVQEIEDSNNKRSGLNELHIHIFKVSCRSNYLPKNTDIVCNEYIEKESVYMHGNNIIPDETYTLLLKGFDLPWFFEDGYEPKSKRYKRLSKTWLDIIETREGAIAP
jgi:glucan phosphoethanolaminetransferase (alkaline phosphatase superfamily)